MNVEIYHLDHDIKLFCITAESFPEGILDAFQKLHSLLSSTEERNFFGISFPDKNGEIIYRAAVEESYSGEAKNYNCETFLLKHGNYISIYLNNISDDPQKIKSAFDKLLANPDIDPEGCCVEMYSNNFEVRCMVRLNSANK